MPTPDEDKEVAHAAFLHAVEQSHHLPHIKGMQEFAGGVSQAFRSAHSPAASCRESAAQLPPRPARAADQWPRNPPRPASCPPRLQLLARQRIPSGQYSDPLGHIFDEFDRDRNGSLTAHEVAEALRSRQVQITDEQAGAARVRARRGGAWPGVAGVCG